KARINDLNDLKQRFFQCMARMHDPYSTESYANLKDKIILCDQIFPSEIISLRDVGIKGVVSLSGTAASHAEILLESFGIPSVSCINDMPIHLMEGKKILIDTFRKDVILNYTTEDEKLLEQPVSPNKKIIAEQIKLKSGEPLWVGATINNPYLEAPQASRIGADGIGLFRTEIGFIGHTTLPTEEELYLEYQHLFLTFANKEIYIRLLDLGSDKLAFFQENKTKEENPCMGNRSTRLLIHRPDILRTQLRAIIRAAAKDTTIILPMISGWMELIQIKKISEKIIEELKTEGIERNIKWGLMVEVPSLVEKFETIVEHFDSFNIGSNDLTQYTLAVDRNNKDVAAYYRYTHPSILSMLAKLNRLCKEKNKKLILCGEMSSRVDLLPLIIGLGIRNFSVPYKKIIAVKSRLMELDFHSCQELAHKALQLSTPDEIEALLK
ncbi:MAG: phosphotransferase system, fructose-specific EI/HPr/EIIA component, partial [uncultured bacterium]